VEGRDEGLTTEDLAGARAGDDDLRVEGDDRVEGETRSMPADESTEETREPIAVGPVGDTPVILDERQGPENVSGRGEDSLESSRRDVEGGGSGAAPASAGVSADGSSSEDSPAQEHGRAGPLIADSDRNEFNARWKDVQFRFVEEPRSAVQEADTLVAEVMQRLAQMFATERARLEAQWSEGDEVSTEDLRQAFRRYRSFFDRLLQA
jgi:hypothetical protein